MPHRRTIIVTLLAAFGLAALFALFAADSPAVLQVTPERGISLVGNNAQDFETVISPDSLERLSWGAVLAGSVMALIIQFVLNMIGLAVGITTVKPEPGEETPDAKTLGMGAALWIAGSALVALFTGGWMAARFAGLPNTTDGVLHGLMVWGVTMLVSGLLMYSAMGRMLSGMGYILGESLRMMGDAASAAVSGVSTVAGGAASVAASAAGSAARGVSTAGRKVADEADMPDMSEATSVLERAREQLMGEVRQYMRDAGIMPERAEQHVRDIADDARSAAVNAARNPEEAQREFDALLDRIFVRGEDAVSDVDRNSLVNLLATRGSMTQDEAMRTVMRWEDTYQQARHEFSRRRDEVRSMAQSVRARAEAEMRDVKEKVEDIKEDVEWRARRAAHTTAEAIAGAAAVIAAALIISGIAAGIGGSLGTPDNIETIEVETTSTLPDAW